MNFLERLPRLDPFPWELATLVVGAVLAIVFVLALLALLGRLLRRRRRQAPRGASAAAIDVAALPTTPFPLEPRLEFYGAAARLAAIVVAPAGRLVSAPEDAALPDLLEQLAPGLGDIARDHRPLVIHWPRQLSAQGFVQAFFNAARLPGDRGKGTIWCSIAGKFEADGQPLLLGLVCCSREPNSLGQVAVQHLGQWRDVLRVRT